MCYRTCKFVRYSEMSAFLECPLKEVPLSYFKSGIFTFSGNVFYIYFTEVQILS